MTYFGLSIVSHPLACEVSHHWRVERHPVLKRRRRWRVVKHSVERPCAYQAGNTIYMHPDLVALLAHLT